MLPITERLWTRLTPWTVAVSFTEPGLGLIVLECARSADAEQIVREHNAYVFGLRGMHEPDACRDCGMPFNNAETTRSGLCRACEA